MSYIGLEPSNSFVSLKRQVITGNGGTSYTLDHSVASVNDVAIFVNNVRQDPAGYSISGAALTLGGTIESSDDCYVIFLGQALQTVTPDANTITTAMIQDSAVTSAKLASGNLTISNGNLLFDTANKGIYLGVNSATASNLLDDYEEGTFTPTLEFGGATTGIAYTQQFGGYTKIGNVVHIKIRVLLSSKGSASGDAKIQGLPFAPADNFTSVSFEIGKGIDTWTNMNTASNYRFVHTDTNEIQLKRIDTNTVSSFTQQVSNSDFNDNSDIRTTYSFTV